MRRSYYRFALVCLALLIGTLLAPGGASLGQTGPQAIEEVVWPQATISATTPSRPGVAQAVPLDKSAFLPFVRTGIAVGPVLFSTTIDADLNPLDPATVFAYGVTQIYATAVLTGAQGLQYKLLTLYNGVPSPSGPRIGNVPYDQPYPVGLIHCKTTGSSCSSGPLVALDRQIITLQVFLNDTLVAQGSATIQ